MSPHPIRTGLARLVRGGPRAGLIALATLLSGAPAAAQSLAGHVREEDTGTPIQAVLVELLAPDSTRVGLSLTARDGRYSITNVGAGTYLLRLNRLGYRTTFVGPVDLRADSILDVSLAADPIALEPVEATGDRRCSVRPEEGEQTARLWEQIYKALAVTDVVQQEGLLDFELVRFERELDLDRTILHSEGLRTWVGSDPFQGVEAEDLARDGFVQPVDEGADVWYMPDADVILSDAFLDTHCFRVVERREAGRRLLGLAFERYDDGDRDDPEFPVRNRTFTELFQSEGADVEGVLWVDAETAALQYLEYVYTGLRSNRLRDIGGGYARYEQLADGKWVVRQWWIRMPVIGEHPVRPGARPRLFAAGLREEGGEVAVVHTPDGEPAMSRDGFPVTGRLIPSDLPIPLDSPTVARFSGTAWLTSVSPDSTFRFPRVPRGRYLATFYHPLLDTLAIDLPVVAVDVPQGTEEIELRIPDRRSVVHEICEDMDGDSRSGILLVTVSAASGEPVAFQDVWLRDLRRREFIRQMTTGTDGRVRFCDVPASTPIEVMLPGRRGEEQNVTLEPGGFARRDLRLLSGS